MNLFHRIQLAAAGAAILLLANCANQPGRTTADGVGGNGRGRGGQDGEGHDGGNARPGCRSAIRERFLTTFSLHLPAHRACAARLPEPHGEKSVLEAWLEGLRG